MRKLKSREEKDCIFNNVESSKHTGAFNNLFAKSIPVKHTNIQGLIALLVPNFERSNIFVLELSIWAHLVPKLSFFNNFRP